jgi:GNAT superfamily N-acetyltransferase
VEIREYRDDDRPAALMLAPRLLEGVAPWRDRDAVLRAVKEWVRESIDAASNDGHAVFVAEDDNGLAGLVTVATRPHFAGDIDAYVGELIVDARSSRSGIGTALMQAAENWARARGLRRLTLDTGAANSVARRFYARLGYLEEDVRLSRQL